MIVSDLDSAGWIERYTAEDPRSRRVGEQLVQAQMPIRPDESPGRRRRPPRRAPRRIFRGWRERTTWRRRQVMDGRSGALDFPGTTWRERPAIDRGDGIFLCGDQVAADGCLSEVSVASATEAAKRALELTGQRPEPQLA